MMRAHRIAGRVKRKLETHARYKRFRELGGGRPSERPIAFVTGNCQADPLSRILAAGPLGGAYEFVRVPPVHLINRSESELLGSLAARAQLLITQPVRDGYRGLPIGSDRLIGTQSTSARAVTFPVLYYEGLYPYQVYVRHEGDTSESAPRTSYADLRTIEAARRGLSDAKALAFIESLSVSRDGIRANADRSRSFLQEREADLDVQVSHKLNGLTFHSVNHPSNDLLAAVADGVAHALGVDAAHTVPDAQFLDDIFTPFEADVRDALKVEEQPRQPWLIRGTEVSEREVFTAHLAWYRAHPEFLQSAVAKHATKLSALGISA